jgi:ATP-dependent Clp protease ATP-binding subunit ClpA
MFERFTERARQVVVFASDEARTLGHNYIGTEHILLGLIREQEGVAARALASLGITAEEVRAQVVGIVGQGDSVTTSQIPFTPRAKKALERALREGIALGHAYVGTEHLLLGLARVNDGVATRILLDLGADAETIRRSVGGLLSGLDSGRAQAPRSGSPGGQDFTPRLRAGRGGSDTTTGAPRFTRGARTVLVLAQEEARTLGHARMGTEHILLGLLREERGLAARLLDALEIALDDVRAEVVDIVGRGTETAAGHILFTPQAKNALDRARHEARSLDHDYVGTEHILLAIMRQDDGIAARILGSRRR